VGPGLRPVLRPELDTSDLFETGTS
jgi:hypothetical protein